jgi:hypothetical protein
VLVAAALADGPEFMKLLESGTKTAFADCQTLQVCIPELASSRSILDLKVCLRVKNSRLPSESMQAFQPLCSKQAMQCLMHLLSGPASPIGSRPDRISMC